MLPSSAGTFRGRTLVTVKDWVLPSRLCFDTLITNVRVCPMESVRDGGTGTT
ncbi:hypothetical protein YC2023_043395 [Brassica napus]